MKFYLPVIAFIVVFIWSGTNETAAQQLSMDMAEVITDVQEYKVPFDDGRTRDPFAGPDGTVYFAGQQQDYIGHYNPETGEFGNFPLNEGAGPHTVVTSEDGTIWYAGNRDRHIGRIDPDTGEITRYEMDSDNLRDPHTFAFDENGNIWFTAQGGNGIGYFNTTSGEVEHEFPVPTPNARPYGIRMSPDGMQPYIALVGTNKLATVNPRTMELTEIELPREETRPRRLDVVSDGTVWYGDFNSGMIGRYDPADGSIVEWELPDGATRPYAVLADDRDRVWFSATGENPNKLIAFDTRLEEFVAVEEIESGRGAIRHMNFEPETRSLWFGTDTGHIGRLIVE